MRVAVWVFMMEMEMKAVPGRATPGLPIFAGRADGDRCDADGDLCEGDLAGRCVMTCITEHSSEHGSGVMRVEGSTVRVVGAR